ncbi:MAG: AsmA family protein [Candidatus Sulfotelmatobacter sp.]
MKVFSFKLRLVAAAVIVLLFLFLAHPGVSRLKARITNSISRAVDRPVEIGSVQLRFLPQPGFDLENLVIYEDPSFGAEPMLRSSEVTAVVRITSLMRGRLDVSRLELTEPSLNLVRRKEDGRWNWESLLERAARTPLAPTAKAKSEPRPSFPYIEASSGRINFKTGAEKKPYALLNADFALWQESENTWGVRLKAEPLRTDMSLSDTGLLRVNGTWQRAATLHETPLQFSAEWDRAQLGQLTKLVSGVDKGWRGDIRFETILRGTPNALQISADTSIQGFHRYDISNVEGLQLVAHCDGKYSSDKGMLHEVFCSGPVGNGLVTLHGDVGRPGLHLADLALNVENLPVNSVVQLARRAKKDLPADLVSAGNVQGNFVFKEDGTLPQAAEFQGHGEVTNLRLESPSTKVEFAPGRVPFALTSESGVVHLSSRKKSGEQPDALALMIPKELHIEYGTFPVALGRPTAAQARGWVGRSGYGVAVRGEGEVSRTLRVASLFGLPTIKANVEGMALMDLQIAGSWMENAGTNPSNFSLPKVTGTVQLHDVHATVRGVNKPIEISSGELKLLPSEARVEKLTARAADAQWTGSVALPRGCGTPGACVVRFNLNTDEIGMGGLYQYFGPLTDERRWYEVLTPAQPGTSSFLENLRASGNISAGRLLIHNLTMNHVSAALDLDHEKLKISNLRFDFLGGKHRGDWQADFTGAPPAYSGSGTLGNVSLDQTGNAMHDAWASGKANGTYQITAHGNGSAAFWQSAAGELHFELKDGTLPRISLASDGTPLQIVHWKDVAHLHNEKIELEKGEIVSFAETYEISGAATLGQILDFKLISLAPEKSAGTGALVYSITGTMADPRVALAPAPETQARLKP